MVTKGYQKGVYEWVTKGIGRSDAEQSREHSHWSASGL